MNIVIWCLALSICTLQFADYWTTAKILQRGGSELNPIMRLLFNVFGLRAGLLIGKFYVALFVLAGARFGWFNGAGLILLIALFAIYGAVVSHNLYQYRTK